MATRGGESEGGPWSPTNKSERDSVASEMRTRTSASHVLPRLNRCHLGSGAQNKYKGVSGEANSPKSST